jgi:hypothetical protein
MREGKRIILGEANIGEEKAFNGKVDTLEVKKKSVVYTIGYRNRYNKENC